jgi:hypothetical protein
MVPLKQLVKCVAVLAFFSGNIFAFDSVNVKITPIGYGAIDVGQVAQGYFYNGQGSFPTPISHIWQERLYGDIGFDAVVKNRLQLEFKGEGLTAFSTPQLGADPETMQPREFFYVKSAFGLYKFGDVDAPLLSIQAGYFPYKYNENVRNLGEYLFRTNTYPLIVYSDFDYPKADLMGCRLNIKLPNKIFENDLIINSELLGMPVQDWSISDIMRSNIADVVTLGIGIDFCHYLNVYQGHYYGTSAEPYFDIQNLPDATKRSFYLISGSDTALFDWKALKTEAQLSFDPKKFIPLGVFGENDLKLYGEMDVIGWKDYPQYYTNIEDRILTMVGFNFPGFKILDLVNIELEYCHNNSAFSDANFYSATSLGASSIIPLDSSSSQYYKINRDPLRWSVYVKKTILDGHVSFIGQVARDHEKLNFYYFDKTYMSFIETLPQTQDWWWTFKMDFNF